MLLVQVLTFSVLCGSGEGEINRRNQLMNRIKTLAQNVEETVNSSASSRCVGKSPVIRFAQLELSLSAAKGRRAGRDVEESEETKNLSNADLMQHQIQVRERESRCSLRRHSLRAGSRWLRALPAGQEDQLDGILTGVQKIKTMRSACLADRRWRPLDSNLLEFFAATTSTRSWTCTRIC